MVDLRDSIHRTEKCLSCHLGTGQKFVDHEMIAAGHPDLYFELASFSAVMPRHWKEAFDKDPWLEARALAVGQAVQLREQLSKVARESKGGTWPEFAELDCFACHHSLTAAKDSWRQQLGYSGRRAGDPPFNLSRYAILREVVNEVDSANAGAFASEIASLYSLITALGSDRAQIATRAASASESANRIAQKISAAPFDASLTERLLRSISADADSISAQGERAAEQAAMALDSLFVAYSRNVKVPNAIDYSVPRCVIQALV